MFAPPPVISSKKYPTLTRVKSNKQLHLWGAGVLRAPYFDTTLRLINNHDKTAYLPVLHSLGTEAHVLRHIGKMVELPGTFLYKIIKII